MKFVQRMLLGFGGLALAALLVTMAVPKVAHAVVATLVQVSNTTANPAITSNMDNPGRVAYQSTQFGTSSVGPGATELGFGVTFPAVPANHRLVVEHVILQAYLLGSGPTLVFLQDDIGELTPLSAFFAPSAQILGQNSVAVDSPVLVYYDQFQVPEVQVSNGAGFVFQNNPPVFTLTGYMLDCSAAPCSAIAH